MIKPPNAIRNHLRRFADDRAAIAVADQNDVGQIIDDDEIDQRLGRLGVADLVLSPLAVAG
jgi:hypothetical protein